MSRDDRNYDYPPASRRISRGTGPDERRYQHLRELLGSAERNADGDQFDLDRALEVLSEEIGESWVEGQRWTSNFEQTRAMVDRQLQQIQADLSGREDRIRRIMSSHERSENPSTTLNPAPMNQESTPSDSARSANRLSRRRVLTQGERPIRDERARDSTGNSLLDEPVPRLGSGSIAPQDLEVDRQLGRWRPKRRKLESDDNREGLRGFSYGQHGQVVPGALKMEIVSCDGGTYEPDGESSWPGNILHNDSSVYCTKSDRCNLILRHRGETPFCLKKIVIKAPKYGFDAPIQEGMVFVSMTSDELLARTAQYHARRRRRNRRSAMQPSQEHLNAFRSPLRSLERTALAGTDLHSNSDNEMTEDGGANATTSSNPATDFRVTTEYDENSEEGGSGDQESDDDAPSVAEIERMHMEQMEEDLLCPDSDESESDDYTSGLSSWSRRRLELRRRARAARHQEMVEYNQALQRRRLIPSPVGPVGATTRNGSHYSGPNSQPPSVLEPHAHFFIEREKSMVSIKFDPPPSGRFILIKLWSPYTGGNIDIQSIIAHGFAGPRFFPAGNFR